jgi:hypothetical protein
MTLRRRINDAIFSNYSDFKTYAVHEVSEKTQIKKNKNKKKTIVFNPRRTTNC